MKLAIMQPYFLPYIGYYQLIHAADVFVVYDNIEYTKKGWYNKNRFLLNGTDHLFTIPLKKDSDFLHVSQRRLADDAVKDCKKILAQISNVYRKAPFYKQTFSLLESLFLYGDLNLFNFIFHSISQTCKHLDINTKFVVSSTININHGLKGKDKVLAICKAMGATEYINPSGGVELYDKSEFSDHNIQLQFLKPKFTYYEQLGNEFIPGLSLLDVLMFNSVESVKGMLNNYDII